MIYFLMHENDRLALFDYDNQSIHGVVINEKMTAKLPFLSVSSKTMEDRLAE